MSWTVKTRLIVAGGSMWDITTRLIFRSDSCRTFLCCHTPWCTYLVRDTPRCRAHYRWHITCKILVGALECWYCAQSHANFLRLEWHHDWWNLTLTVLQTKCRRKSHTTEEASLNPCSVNCNIVAASSGSGPCTISTVTFFQEALCLISTHNQKTKTQDITISK